MILTNNMMIVWQVKTIVKSILTTNLKLNSIGIAVSQKWNGAFLLAALCSTYDPFIMGIERSGVRNY